MDFKRNIDPKEALQIGWQRRLSKGDKFILIVSEYKEHPEQEHIAIATEEEESRQHWYTDKTGTGEYDYDLDWYEIRQVKWQIPEVASGVAEMHVNCEKPQWVYTNNPIAV